MFQEHSSCLFWRGGALLVALAWGRFVVWRLWLLVAGYAVLASAQLLGCPGVSRSHFLSPIRPA